MSQLLRMGTTYRQFALMATENNSIPISDVNTKDPTMRMTEGDRVKITVYNSNSSKPPHSLRMHQSHSGIMDGVAGMSGYSPGGHYSAKFMLSKALPSHTEITLYT